jgi:hypothetical protein
MSRPDDKTQRSRPPGATGAPRRPPDAGIARGPGLLVVAVTAAIVFGIGQQLFPVKPKQPAAPTPAAPAPVAPTPPAPEPRPVADGAATVAAPPAIDAGAVAAKVADAGATGAAAPEKRDEAAASEKAEKPPAPPADEAAAGADDGKPIDKQRQADKDLAREAWRRNRPDVSVTGGKTSILVPIRGSIKGADFKILDKRRKVIVTLPKAVSMVTMRLYSLKHPSFKKLWIDQDEANAQPADGTKLRFILSQSFDPQVEITDDFVRVTIRRPEPGDDARAEKHGDRADRAEKHGDRVEKRSEPSDDGAPPADKSGD